MFEKGGAQTISITTGTMVRGLLVMLGFFLIWLLSDVVLIVLTAIVIASFVESGVPYFKKLGIGRVFGVAILYILSILVFAGLFYLFAPLFITEIYNFATFISSYVPGVTFLDFFQSDAFGSAKDIVSKLSSNLSLSSLLVISKTFISNLSGGFIQTLSVAFGGVFNFVLIIIISFYLSIQEKGIENFLRIILPIKYEDYAIDLWQRSRRKIALWVRGQMFVAFLVAVFIFLLLSLIGIQYALLLSIIAGVMSFLPYGSLVALIPAMSFSYLSGGLKDSLMVAAVYLIIHQFETFLFSPLIIKRVVGISPLMVILSVLIGFELGGFWGLVLAIPVAVFVMELMNDIEKKKTEIRSENRIKDEKQ
ncbi:MAG: AI-2E family transporter [bacterium]|nr:AI-2E family transporter [bacterium]